VVAVEVAELLEDVEVAAGVVGVESGEQLVEAGLFGVGELGHGAERAQVLGVLVDELLGVGGQDGLGEGADYGGAEVLVVDGCVVLVVVFVEEEV